MEIAWRFQITCFQNAIEKKKRKIAVLELVILDEAVIFDLILEAQLTGVT